MPPALPVLWTGFPKTLLNLFSRKRDVSSFPTAADQCCSGVFLLYLIELCVPHGREFKSRLLALVLQHPIQQLGGRLHVVAVVMIGVIGGAVKQAHDGLGAFAVHPRAVATQVLILESQKKSKGARGGKRRERIKAGQKKGEQLK